MNVWKLYRKSVLAGVMVGFGGFCIWSSVFVLADLMAAPPGRDPATTPSPAPTGGGDCVEAIVQSAQDDWVTAFSHPSQKIKLTSSVNVCRVELYLRNPSTTNTVELRTATGGGGSLIGASSGVESLSGNWVAFTFSAPVTVAADYYLTWAIADGTGQWNKNTADVYEVGGGYDGSGAGDFAFKVFHQ
jgi:hypothetical protein